MFSLFSCPAPGFSAGASDAPFSYAVTAAAGVTTAAPAFADPHRLRRALSREVRALLESLLAAGLADDAALDDEAMRALGRCSAEAACRVLEALRDRQAGALAPPLAGADLRRWLDSRLRRAARESAGWGAAVSSCASQPPQAGTQLFRRALGNVAAQPPLTPPEPSAGILRLDLRNRGQLPCCAFFPPTPPTSPLQSRHEPYHITHKTGFCNLPADWDQAVSALLVSE